MGSVRAALEYLPAPRLPATSHQCPGSCRPGGRGPGLLQAAGPTGGCGALFTRRAGCGSASRWQEGARGTECRRDLYFSRRRLPARRCRVEHVQRRFWWAAAEVAGCAPTVIDSHIVVKLLALGQTNFLRMLGKL